VLRELVVGGRSFRMKVQVVSRFALQSDLLHGAEGVLASLAVVVIAAAAAGHDARRQRGASWRRRSIVCHVSALLRGFH